MTTKWEKYLDENFCTANPVTGNRPCDDGEVCDRCMMESTRSKNGKKTEKNIGDSIVYNQESISKGEATTITIVNNAFTDFWVLDAHGDYVSTETSILFSPREMARHFLRCNQLKKEMVVCRPMNNTEQNEADENARAQGFDSALDFHNSIYDIKADPEDVYVMAVRFNWEGDV